MPSAPFPAPTAKYHSTTYPTLSPSRPELSAGGKSILITGGGTGIGAETARYFALAGASRIALLGRRPQPLLDTKAALEKEFPGIEIFAAPTDVFVKSEVDAAFDKFLGPEGKKLDVVVHGAAFTGPQGRLQDTEAEEFLATVDKNVRASLFVSQAFLRYAKEDAVVVNISSNAAVIEFGGRFSPYCVGKMAAIRLWDSVAGANPGLSVFHIQPGVVDTDMNREAGGIEGIGWEDHGELTSGGLLC